MNELAKGIVAELERTPRQFAELIDANLDASWRDFLKAWGEVRAADIVKRDDDGAYYIGPDR